MKRFTIATGICAVLVIAAILAAGCTSPQDSSAPGTDTATQVTQTIAQAPAGSGISPQLTGTTTSAPAPDQGTLAGSAGNAGTDAGMDAAAVADDATIDPYNGTSQPATMVPDSADLGNPIP
jgi:hypothetical protein